MKTYKQQTKIWGRVIEVENLILLTALIFLDINFKAVSGLPVSKISKAESYLFKYGYLSHPIPSAILGGTEIAQDNTLKNAIEDFQYFAGLNMTGILDDETLKTMSLPRCGISDKVEVGPHSRSKRYSLFGSRWGHKNLTYKISKYSKWLTKDKTDTEIFRAFAVWSQYTDLTFTQQNEGKVDIDIMFVEGEHNDGSKFDGPLNVLAHALQPEFGDTHFDDSEFWTFNTTTGINLFQTAVHEFGHALGLNHSDVKSSIMAPIYHGYAHDFHLDADDISAIQILYGKKNDGSSLAASKPIRRTSSMDTDLCRSSRMDTLFKDVDGQIYIFQGSKYYMLTENSIVEGYPKAISEGWPGLPGNIDAAFTSLNGNTYFFKGSQYWRFSNTRMDEGFPRNISSGFPGIPENIDAAMVWGFNGKIYFFKGSEFWRFDQYKSPPVRSTYPISAWKGLPNNLDASLSIGGGFTYFFKGDKYYRFNDVTLSVDAANTTSNWIGCYNTSLGNGTVENFFSDRGTYEMTNSGNSMILQMPGLLMTLFLLLQKVRV